jgi:hypothetical protein
MGYALSPTSRQRNNYSGLGNSNSPNVQEKPGPVSYLVCLVHPGSLIDPTKSSRSNEHNRLVEKEDRRTQGGNG